MSENIEAGGAPVNAEKANAADESEVAMVTDEPTSEAPTAPPTQQPAPEKSTAEEAPTAAAPAASAEESAPKHDEVPEKAAPKETTPEKAPAEPEKPAAESEKAATEPEKPAELEKAEPLEKSAEPEKPELEKSELDKPEHDEPATTVAEDTAQKKVPEESGDQVRVKNEAKVAETPSIPPPSAQPQSEANKEQSKQLVLPTRQYLDATVVPILHSALSQLAKVRPEDPIEYLGKYLLEYKKDYKHGGQ